MKYLLCDWGLCLYKESELPRDVTLAGSRGGLRLVGKSLKPVGFGLELAPTLFVDFYYDAIWVFILRDQRFYDMPADVVLPRPYRM